MLDLTKVMCFINNHRKRQHFVISLRYLARSMRYVLWWCNSVSDKQTDGKINWKREEEKERQHCCMHVNTMMKLNGTVHIPLFSMNWVRLNESWKTLVKNKKLRNFNCPHSNISKYPIFLLNCMQWSHFLILYSILIWKANYRSY